jgi:FtsZ-interacting cell division protein YlmF
MNDLSPPSSGHNQGPVFNPDLVEELSAKAGAVADAAGEWKDAGKIISKEQAQKANDFLSGARLLFKEIEERRKAEKQPFLDAGREIDAAFNRVKETVERSAKLVKPLVEAFLREEEAKERARKAEEERKAREEAAAAERARRQAEERNDVVGQQEAEERAKAAREAEAEAKRAESAKLDSATGGGKRTALRTSRFAVITNVNQAMLHYRDHPEMTELLLRLANSEVRSAKGKAIKIPGFEIKEERKL